MLSVVFARGRRKRGTDCGIQIGTFCVSRRVQPKKGMRFFLVFQMSKHWSVSGYFVFLSTVKVDVVACVGLCNSCVMSPR